MNRQLAKNIMPAGGNQVNWFFQNGSTNDIISTILYADERSAKFTERFAETMQGQDAYTVARNIWRFLKNNIQYVEDKNVYGAGKQMVKSPSQLVTDGFGDCKSFSVFTGSVLQNLGIPYEYKFTVYPDQLSEDERIRYAGGIKPDVKHVYVQILTRGRHKILIDAVWDAFDSEKKGSINTRIIKPKNNMAKIAYIEGVRGAKIGCGCSGKHQVGAAAPSKQNAITGFAVSALMIGAGMVLGK